MTAFKKALIDISNELALTTNWQLVTNAAVSTSDEWTTVKDEYCDVSAEVRDSFDSVVSELLTSVHVYLLQWHTDAGTCQF